MTNQTKGLLFLSPMALIVLFLMLLFWRDALVIGGVIGLLLMTVRGISLLVDDR